MKIVIPASGLASGDNKPRTVLSDESGKIMSALGDTQVKRVSHVEPGHAQTPESLAIILGQSPELFDSDQNLLKQYEGHWFADLTPTGNEVVLGPFDPDDRKAALDAEVAWLHNNNIPPAK